MRAAKSQDGVGSPDSPEHSRPFETRSDPGKPIINGKPLLRNSFRQPNFFNVDFRLSKFFTVHENHKLALIFDMFNLTNKHNFLYNASTNESTTTAARSLWCRGQTLLPAFRTIHLSPGTPTNCSAARLALGVDPMLNCAGATIAPPFQLQVALRTPFDLVTMVQLLSPALRILYAALGASPGTPYQNRNRIPPTKFPRPR